MAHELEVVNGTASMFYAKDRGVPWHGLGQAADEAETSERVLELAGLNWDVALGSVWGGPRQELVAGRFSIYRVTDGRVLGVTLGKTYQPIQNRDVFSFLDNLVQDRVMRYETAGSIQDGRRVWVLARLDEDIEIAGDEYKPYLLAVTNHDAGGSLRMYPTMVRVVCSNTLTSALNASQMLVSVIHSGNTQAKLSQAQKVLNITTATMRRYQEWLEKLTFVQVKEAQLAAVKDTVFGALDDDTPTQRKKAIELFQAIYEAEQVLHGQSAYSLVQTATGFADHGTRVRAKGTGDEHMASVLGGQIFYTKNKILGTVSKVLDLPALVLPDGTA